ncbi:LamG-like jellyroll fold domain-containing protein [Nocardioides sp.]|uniref:LamG-like jellyroll fold domain-containing protein n=1 Tax=Nocardioides sp. TaxID=35761 RepID=UPI0026077AC1|nr:LamG-like jellyroll fold domain-containing protein [Nocardioides sp.]
MRSRRSLTGWLQRAATAAVGVAVAVTALMDVPASAATPTPIAPASTVMAALPAAAPAALPVADILDVDGTDGASPFKDKAAGRAGVVYGAPTAANDASLKRSVATFDGTKDAVVFPLADAWKAETSPNITQSVSIECVFRFEGTLPTTAEKDVCSGKQAGGYTIRVSGGNIQAQMYVGGAYQYASAPLATNTWYHTVATYDGTAVRLYVNGVLAATTPVSGTVTPPPGGYFALGADSSTTGTAEFHAPVSIALARIYSAPLAASSVAALATAVGLTPKAPTPDVLDVDFSTGAPRETAASMAATTWGTPTYRTNADLQAGVMAVDGVDDAVSFADFAGQWSKLGSAFTVECVFRVDQALPVTGEKDLCSDKEAGGLSIYVNGATLGTMAYIGGGYKTVTTPIDGERWYHALSVWDGSTLSLYLNGVLASSTAATGALTVPPNATARHFVIGGDASPNGIVAQWAPPSSYAAAGVFSRAVNAAEAKLLAGQWNTTPPAPKADIVDVDFADGTSVDHAQNLTVTRLGDPQIGTEEALDKKVGTFDGSDDAYAYAFGNEWSKLAGGFSLECTFRFNGTQPAATENAICSDKESGGFATVVNSSGLTFMAYVGGSYKSVSVPINTGQWYTTLATWDGTTIKLYVDGVLAGSVAASGTLGLPSGDAKTALMLGADTNTNAVGQFFGAATVATMRVFGRALGAADAIGLNVAALGDHRDAGVELVSTTPKRGALVSSPVEFDATITHVGSATRWRYTLDGATITPGQRIGAGLSAGTHTIAISATDVFGKAISWTVTFTSTTIPTGTGTQTGQGKGKVTLSAIAESNDGSDVTTTFKRANATAASGGFSGVVPVLPSTLDFTYTHGATISGSAVPDGKTLDSPSTGQIPFQRFDMTLPSSVDGQEIVWSGVVDPERSVSLRAWNVATGAWSVLGTARGTAEGDTTLSGAVRPTMLDKGVVHVLVTGDDPFADDLSPHDSSAQNTKDSFEKPEDYDFSMVHFTDTQYLAEGAAGGTYDNWNGVAESKDVMKIEEQAVWQKAYTASTEWIRDNAAARKIKYTAHTGDVIENDYYDPLKKDGNGNLLYPGLNEEVDKELAFTSGAHKVLDDAGLVNQVIAGNHDNQLGAETGPTSRFSSTFSAARYYASSKLWPADQKASFHTWDETTAADGSTTVAGKDSQNNYVLFSAGGLDFVAVGLSYGVTAEEAAWASSIFARYHDRNGILLTHAYLAPSSNPDGRGASFSADGSRLYNQVVTANPNVFLVLAGHEHGVGTNLKTGVGVTVAHNVVELLADYQFYTVSAGELFPGKADKNGNIDLDGDGTTDHKSTDQLQFGASFLRLLQFDVKRSEMHVDTYSPLLKNFGATEYDTAKRYNGAEDNMVLPVDLSSRTTSFGTDGLTLVTPGDTVIGESTARSGWPATATWSGLTEGQVYAWTATSRNAAGEKLGTVDQFGGVFVASAGGTDVTAPVITVPATTTLSVGATFDPLAEVSAKDNVDGDVTSSLQVLGSVDTTKAGTYALTYLVSDANGNQAIATRSVSVTAPTTPSKAATTITAGNASVTFGGSLTLSAQVTAASATGTVTFITGEEIWCTAQISAGKASCQAGQLPPPGTYAVRAVYSGDTTHEASQNALAVVVKEATSALRATSTTVRYGAATTVAVSVTGATSGTVTLTEAGRTLGSAPISGGVARIGLAARSLRPGAHRLVATYAGTGTVSGSSTTLTVNVTKVSSAVRLSVVKAKAGKVTVRVQVTAAGLSPTGVVTVKVGRKTRTVTLRGGAASVTVTGLGKGRTKVTAGYAGDALTAASATSTTVVVRRGR